MKKYLLLFATVFCICLVNAQYQNVRVSPDGTFNEPCIMINPHNTLEIMIGTNLNYWFYSEDAGLTWEQGILTEPTYGVMGDPVLIADTLGDFYYFHLSNPVSGNWIDRIVCQKFDKQTLTWGPGTYMGLNGSKAQDKEWAVVDRNNNIIYVTWTQFDDYGSNDPDCKSNIMFSKSIDAGQTWSPALRINEVEGNCVDSDDTTEGAVPAVGPNGEIYVSWSGPAGIVFDRSLDQGESWLEEDIFVNEHIGGWDISIPGVMRSNGMPVTKCDLSGGPYHGTIYINYADQSNGSDDTDIWLTKSTDGGDTWSEPVRVNDDPPGKHQFFTWLDIDQVTGHLYFVFYDRRSYENNQTDVYLAISQDGGETFENIKISDSPFTPQSNVFFGDYNNISAYNNQVRPVWTRMVNGVRSIWTAIIDLNVGVPIKELRPFSLEQNYPNPFLQNTTFSYKISEPGAVHLAVFDQFGRMVTLLENNTYLERGSYQVFFDASQYQLPPGVYYISLKSNKFNMNRKMVISGF